MQIVLNTIYQRIAESKNQEVALIKSVGDSVFKELLHNFKYPPSLILKVKGIGSFYLRNKKLTEYLRLREDFYFNPNNEKALDAKEKDLERFNEKKVRYLNLLNREIDYLGYLEKKAEIRKIRNLTQPLIPKKPEDNDI